MELMKKSKFQLKKKKEKENKSLPTLQYVEHL